MDPVVPDAAPYVSAGELPSPEHVRRSVDEAYERFRTENGGGLSAVSPRPGAGVAPAVRHLPGRGPAATGGERHGAAVRLALRRGAQPRRAHQADGRCRRDQHRRPCPGHAAEAREGFVLDGLSRLAGGPPALDVEVYASAAVTDHRNRALADLLESNRLVGSDWAEAVDRRTRQSCLRVTAADLAVRGATLADGGVNRSRRSGSWTPWSATSPSP
jgi:glutaminase